MENSAVVAAVLATENNCMAPTVRHASGVSSAGCANNRRIASGVARCDDSRAHNDWARHNRARRCDDDDADDADVGIDDGCDDVAIARGDAGDARE
jgi:hypothetical protein